MVQDTINEIGERLLHCPLHCEGILNEPEAGIIPRGLIFESRPVEIGSLNKRCLIIGLNPGNTDDQQRVAYQNMDPLTYTGVT